MDSSPDQIIKEFPGFVRVYKDGRVEKLSGTAVVPAGLHPSSGVQSKDVVISPPTTLSARLYIPKPNSNTNTKKLPLLIYYHGGGFVIETAASPIYHNFLNLIAAESNVVIVSVDYRTTPEHPITTCYEDSWEAIKWVATHDNGNGPEPWLNEYPDLGHVFVGGDSAGANIAHHMAIRMGSESLGRSINLEGIILLHPYFWGKDRIGCEGEHPWQAQVTDIWMFSHPGTSGADDPLINPEKDPKVSDIRCGRILVCVAEKDVFKDRGWCYRDILERNGWKGEMEIVEDKGEDHVFFLLNPASENAGTLRNRICTFMNHITSQVSY